MACSSSSLCRVAELWPGDASGGRSVRGVDSRRHQRSSHHALRSPRAKRHPRVALRRRRLKRADGKKSKHFCQGLRAVLAVEVHRPVQRAWNHERPPPERTQRRFTTREGSASGRGVGARRRSSRPVDRRSTTWRRRPAAWGVYAPARAPLRSSRTAHWSSLTRWPTRPAAKTRSTIPEPRGCSWRALAAPTSCATRRWRMRPGPTVSGSRLWARRERRP